MKHSQIGLTRSVPIGFSWTTFFFGPFPALLRGDIKWGCIMAVIAFISCGLSWLIFPFFYNKLYVKDLAERGYRPMDSTGEEVLKNLEIIFDNSSVTT